MICTERKLQEFARVYSHARSTAEVTLVFHIGDRFPCFPSRHKHVGERFPIRARFVVQFYTLVQYGHRGKAVLHLNTITAKAERSRAMLAFYVLLVERRTFEA